MCLVAQHCKRVRKETQYKKMSGILVNFVPFNLSRLSRLQNCKQFSFYLSTNTLTTSLFYGTHYKNCSLPENNLLRRQPNEEPNVKIILIKRCLLRIIKLNTTENIVHHKRATLLIISSIMRLITFHLHTSRPIILIAEIINQMIHFILYFLYDYTLRMLCQVVVFFKFKD